MASTWQHQHGRVDRGLEAFFGLILLVSESPKSQLKVSDTINMMGWPGSHLGPYSTLGICLEGDNWVKQGFGSLFGLNLMGFWDSRERTKGVFMVDMASTWQHQHGVVAWGPLGPLQYPRNLFRGGLLGKTGVWKPFWAWFHGFLRLPRANWRCF